MHQFDAAAETHGVERVRNTHNGYLASCGLTVPRLDNIHRTVDFALDMQRIVSRFNAETGHNIRLRAGIDTGAVTSGLIGRAGLVPRPLGGGAPGIVDSARAVQPGVYVTQKVYEVTLRHPAVRAGRRCHHRRRSRGNRRGGCRRTSGECPGRRGSTGR